MIVLGIESSCDETAAAIVRNGNEILSSVIYSQIEKHRPFGGVVPELASREHLTAIGPVVAQAFEEAGIGRGEIDGVAVTQGPGLIGSLLVGVSYAKAFALGLGKPLIGVNHIEGHMFSVVFDNPEIPLPAMALIVSGGHTNIFYMPEWGKYKLVSRTRDDAAGEAFDKVAKMMGLGYPGGPAIENLAANGDPKAVRFTRAKISDGRPDLSFSGLKTAVSRYISEAGISSEGGGGQAAADLAASFQHAVVSSLVETLSKQAQEFGARSLIVAGGVACNGLLRSEAFNAAEKLGIPAAFPSKHLTTDNAAMIAAAGHFHLSRGEVAEMSMTADITLRLQNLDVETDPARKKKVRYRI